MTEGVDWHRRFSAGLYRGYTEDQIHRLHELADLRVVEAGYTKERLPIRG